MKKHEEKARGLTSFLLAQVGAQAASRYAERLAALRLSPAQSGMLRVLGKSAGISQKALAESMAILPSRLVVLVDELEALGLVERRDSADDRRVYALHLSDKGRRVLDEVGRVALAHDDSFLSPLAEEERSRLRSILTKLADHEGLVPGVHPGYRRLAKKDADEPSEPTPGARRRR